MRLKHTAVRYRAYTYEISTNKEQIVSACGVVLPRNINFLQEKVSYEIVPLYSVTLFLSGELAENYAIQLKQIANSVYRFDPNSYDEED